MSGHGYKKYKIEGKKKIQNWSGRLGKLPPWPYTFGSFELSTDDEALSLAVAGLYGAYNFWPPCLASTWIYKVKCEVGPICLSLSSRCIEFDTLMEVPSLTRLLLLSFSFSCSSSSLSLIPINYQMQSNGPFYPFILLFLLPHYLDPLPFKFLSFSFFLLAFILLERKFFEIIQLWETAA